VYAAGFGAPALVLDTFRGGAVKDGADRMVAIRTSDCNPISHSKRANATLGAPGR
jgi:hypothetical protein